jgi:hypothetical protein
VLPNGTYRFHTLKLGTDDLTAACEAVAEYIKERENGWAYIIQHVPGDRPIEELRAIAERKKIEKMFLAWVDSGLVKRHCTMRKLPK